MDYRSENGLLSRATGSARIGPGHDPFSVRVLLLEHALEVVAIDGTANASATRWPLAAIRTVDEVDGEGTTEPKVDIRFHNGSSLLLTPSGDFTTQLLDQLRTKTAAMALPASPAPAGTTVPAADTPPPPFTPDPPPYLSTPATVPTPGGSVPERRRRRWAATAIGVLLVIGLGVTATGAVQLRERANDAQRLADRREGQLRSAEDDLDAVRAELRETESERDDLDLRISELTNEKAEVQDERNAAQELARLGADAAAEMLRCRDLILDAMSYMVDDYYISANIALDAAVPVCQAANTTVAAFSDAVG